MVLYVVNMSNWNSLRKLTQNGEKCIWGRVMTNSRQSPYKPIKPVLPETANPRSPKSSPYDASGRPKSE